MKKERPDGDVIVDVLRRLDPSGEAARRLDEMEALSGSPLGSALLALAGVPVDELTDLLEGQRAVQGVPVRTALELAPRGWTPSRSIQVALYERAFAERDRTGSYEIADEVLVDGWNQTGVVDPYINRLRGIAAWDTTLNEVFRRRADLVDKALAHHRAGAFEASVPIVLTQIDGIAHDLIGRSFFDEGRRGLLDDETFVGMPEGLWAMSKQFSKTQRTSASRGELSRHAILHGRELAYDTAKNSTQVFVLLLGVIEWAQGKTNAEWTNSHAPPASDL